VTKFICNYIKEKDLQDPADRRNIRVEQDPSLKKLLSFDGKDKKPLTYYTLQSYLKGHFLPAPAVEASEAPAPAKGKKGKASPAPEPVEEEEPVLEEEAPAPAPAKASKRKVKAQ
jgi:chromatin remodeling complex protein RSC6